MALPHPVKFLLYHLCFANTEFISFQKPEVHFIQLRIAVCLPCAKLRVGASGTAVSKDISSLWPRNIHLYQRFTAGAVLPPRGHVTMLETFLVVTAVGGRGRVLLVSRDTRSHILVATLKKVKRNW